MNQNENILDLYFVIKPQEEEIYTALISEILELTPISIWEEDTKTLSMHIYTSIENAENIKINLVEKLRDLTSKGILSPVQLKQTVIEGEDWLHSWKKYFTPIMVEGKIQITPSWYAPNPNVVNLFLEPKMGFGTGQHATTYLCLKALAQMDVHEKNIIDIGAGSGILGVAALLLGAKNATLLEIDPLAIDSCNDTVQRNGVKEKAEVFLGDVFNLPSKIKEQKYDLAFINIIAEVICEILPLPFVKKIPVLILSGILEVKENTIVEVLKKEGYEIIARESLKEWVCLKVCFKGK